MAGIVEAQVVGVDGSAIPTVSKTQSHARPVAESIDAVRNMGMPLGLAEQFVKSTRDFSYRFWIIGYYQRRATGVFFRVNFA